MKAVMVIVAIMVATAVNAADQVVNVRVTIPDAMVAEMVEVIANEIPLYTNVVTVYTNGPTPWTNVVRTVVSETPKNKFRRVSVLKLAEYWARKLRRHRQVSIPEEDPITTD